MTKPPLPPPPPRPYQSIRASGPTSESPTSAPTKPSLISRLFGFGPQPVHEPKNLQRGIEATQRVIREGVLDPRYRPAANRVTAIIVSLTIVIGLGYELFQRRFMGKEQRMLPVKKVEERAGDAGT